MSNNSMLNKPKGKFNILFISSNYNYFVNNNANFERMYNYLKFFQNNNEFNVFVLQPSREKKLENKKLKKQIICFYYKPLQFLKLHLFIFNDFNLFYIIKVMKIVNKYRIDLIHIESIYGINILRFIKNIPVSYNSYNVGYLYTDKIFKYYHRFPRFSRYFLVKYQYFLDKYAIKFVKNINSVSIQDKKEFIKIFNVPKEKINVNSYGFVREIFNKPLNKKLARERLKIDINKFVAIFHGFYLNKGNMEAFNLIRYKITPKLRNENILFLLAGKSMPLAKNEENIKYLGYVENLNEFLYSADVAVIPLMTGSGIKTKILDYLSAQIPIISTKTGTAGLYLKDKLHGYIVNDSTEDIIKAILKLKRNPEKIDEIKFNIKKLLMKEFNWDKIFNRLLKTYKKIIFQNRI